MIKFWLLDFIIRRQAKLVDRLRTRNLTEEYKVEHQRLSDLMYARYPPKDPTII